MAKSNDVQAKTNQIKNELNRIQFLTLYERLGVPENATTKQINEAYKEKSEICSAKPPVEGSKTLNNLLSIAKNMLADPVSREIYDTQMKGFSTNQLSAETKEKNNVQNKEDRPQFSSALAKNEVYQDANKRCEDAFKNYITACNDPTKTPAQAEKIANLKNQIDNTGKELEKAFWQQVKDRGIPEDKLRNAQNNMEDKRAKYAEAKAYGMNSEIAINACKEYAQAGKELRQVFDGKYEPELKQNNDNKKDGLAKAEPMKISETNPQVVLQADRSAKEQTLNKAPEMKADETHPQKSISADRKMNDPDNGLKKSPEMKAENTNPQVAISADTKSSENDKASHITPKNPFSTDMKR
jgi:hypothetical protein